MGGAESYQPNADPRGGWHLQPSWYAVYTRSRHEKTVTGLIQQRGIETFLPLYEVVRRWRNGRHRVQLPLFTGYSFVRIAVQDRLQVLKVPGVVRLVGFNGLPTPLPDEDVEAIRLALSHGLKAEPHPYINVGQRVKVTGGSLASLEGILVRRKGSTRLIVSIGLIQRSVQVELPAEAVAGIPGPATPTHKKKRLVT